MKDEFVKNIGIWGQRHYNYLNKSNPTVVNVMRMKGTLEQYLTDLDRDAQDMFEIESQKSFVKNLFISDSSGALAPLFLFPIFQKRNNIG